MTDPRPMIKRAFASRWTLSAGSVAFSGAVFAAAQEPSAGPSWEVIAVGTWGLLTTVIGVVAMTWTAAISSRVKDVEKSQHDMDLFIRDNYHKRHEVIAEWGIIHSNIKALAGSVHNVQTSVRALHVRMDMLFPKHKHMGADDGSATG